MPTLNHPPHPGRILVTELKDHLGVQQSNVTTYYSYFDFLPKPEKLPGLPLSWAAADLLAHFTSRPDSLDQVVKRAAKSSKNRLASPRTAQEVMTYVRERVSNASQKLNDVIVVPPNSLNGLIRRIGAAPVEVEVTIKLRGTQIEALLDALR